MAGTPLIHEQAAKVSRACWVYAFNHFSHLCCVPSTPILREMQDCSVQVLRHGSTTTAVHENHVSYLWWEHIRTNVMENSVRYSQYDESSVSGQSVP